MWEMAKAVMHGKMISQYSEKKTETLYETTNTSTGVPSIDSNVFNLSEASKVVTSSSGLSQNAKGHCRLSVCIILTLEKISFSLFRNN